MSALRELIAKFSVDTGSAVNALKGLHEKVEGVSEKLEGLGELFLESALVEGFREMVSSTIEVAAQLQDTSERLGVTTDLLQRFGFMAKLSGASAEGAATGLQFLNRSMADVANGVKGAADPFTQLGVNVLDANGHLRTVEDILPELADGFEKLQTPQQRTAAAMTIFGRQGAALIPILKEGSKGIDELTSQFNELGGGISKDFIEKADKVDKQLMRMKQGLGVFRSEIVIGALPALQWFSQKASAVVGYLIKFARHTNLAKEAVAILGSAAGLAALKAAAGVAKLFGLFPKGEMSLLKTLASFGELGLIVGIAILLFLAFEDIYNLIEGNESLIGNLMTEFLGADEATQVTEALRTAWNAVEDALKAVGPPLMDLLSAFGKIALAILPSMVEGFSVAVKIIAAAVTLLAAFVTSLLKIPEAIKKGDWNVIGSVIDKAGNAVFGKNGIYAGVADKALHVDAQGRLDALDSPSVPATSTVGGGSGAGGPVQQNIQVGDITVQGGPTNAGTADAVKNGIQSAFGDAVTQSDLNSAYAGGYRNIP